MKTQSGYEPEKETTTATGKVLGFGPVYDHIQILEWEHNGDEYRNADQTLDYNLKGPFATFKGKTKDEIDGNGYEFTATLKAKYAASIGGVERGGEAVIKTTGDATGDFAVDKKKAPTG
ncbi:chemotaxis protein [Halogeometricum borinquense]|uniref:Chemotaxis protein n=1 Tax=Halogeometricum borinquense TaxID=60847 RepID=A0A6C0UPM2_9EURY|nr:chemotaxis protein [Halogeometricum borinquense]